MTVIDESDQSQAPDQKSLTYSDYALIVPFGFLSFVFGWIANAVVQSIFQVQVMTDIWEYFYNEILGYPGMLFACFLSPFIAAFLAIITSSIVHKRWRNKDVTHISAILITFVYGFSPLSGIPLFG